MALKCAGCFQIIPNREYLTCCQCKNKYDLICANVSIQRFLSTMTVEYRAVWKCDGCRLKEPRKNNINTPVRHQQFAVITSPEAEGNSSFSNNNITLRTKTTNTRDYDDTRSTIEDLSVLDNTLNIENCTKTSKNETIQTPNNQAITLHQFEDLLDVKLKAYTQSLFCELKEYIKTLISGDVAKMKKEITQTTDKLILEQTTLKENIKCLNSKMIELENKNSKLREEIEMIQNSCNQQNTQKHESTSSKKDEISADKKIVIYGLEESAWETDLELRDRVTYLFQAVLNINLSGYLEDIKRIGNKKGRRRPLLVELLSRNRTNFILKNRRAFKNTGIAVSELLEGEQLKERKKLIENLITARKNGYRAKISNNKLIIEGKEFIPTSDHKRNSKSVSNQQVTRKDETIASLASPQKISISNPTPTKQHQFFRK